MLKIFILLSLLCSGSVSGLSFQANKKAVLLRTEQDLSNALRADTGAKGTKPSMEALTNIERLIEKLELSPSTQNPTSSPLIDGCWRLVYTSSPSTNSPIQRTFTALDNVAIYQVVNLVNRKGSFLPKNLPDVSNVVCFGGSARLRVTALGSTVSNSIIALVFMRQKHTMPSSMQKPCAD